MLPENIGLLSKCEFKRRDHLSESLAPSAAAPAPATIQSQEGQLRSSLNPVIAHLVKKSKTVAPDFSVENVPKKQECDILPVMSWTKQLSCEPLWTPQTGQRIWVKGVVLLVCA